MTNILDAVEPDGYRMFDGEGHFDFREELPEQASIDWAARYGRKWEEVYSRETVERLLAEHRKQVLLEAAEKYLKNDDDLLMREYVADWLRRMAEGEK